MYEETSKAMGTTLTDGFMNALSVTITDNLIFTSQNIAISLEKNSSGVFYLRLTDGAYLSTASATYNTFLLQTGVGSGDKANQASWVITINEDATADIFNAFYSRYLEFASSDFRAYKNHFGNPVHLYKKVTVPSSLTLRAKGDDSNYYATFSSTEDVVFDNDVTVSTVSVANGALQVKPLEKGTYSVSSLDRMQVEDGYYVPANTGVLLTTPVTSTTCYAPLAKQNVTVDDTNLLVAVSEDGVFKGEDGYKYYKLAYDNSTNRTGLGFFWGAANGAPFMVVAGLAYLAVPNAVAASVKSGLRFPRPCRRGSS